MIKNKKEWRIFMSFSILSNSLVNKDNSTALRKGLFEAQTLSYRKILSQSWRDELLPDIVCLSKNTCKLSLTIGTPLLF